jgi:RNA polymerase sigma factor (sigma-70 family)
MPSLLINRWSAGIRQWRYWASQRWAVALHRPIFDADAGTDDPSTAVDSSGEVDFDVFFMQFEQPLYGYIRRVVASQEIAVDIVQETFVRAWSHFAVIRRYQRPQAWLYRVATHLALSQRRDQHTIAFTEMQVSNGAAGVGTEDRWTDPLDLEGQTVARDTINQILQSLPARQRAALLLRAVYGLSFAEVAAALGVTPVAARKLLSRAREQFRTLFTAQQRE